MQLKFPEISARKVILVHLQSEQDKFSIVAGKVNPKQPDSSTNWKEVETLEELVKTFGKHYPYLIHINGFGVLTRIVENAPGYRESLLVSGSESEFYFSDYAFNGKIAVSFIRRSVIADIIAELGKQKVHLHGIFVGPIPILASKSNFDLKQNEYEISISNNELIRLERNTAESAVGFLEYSRKHLQDLSYDTSIENYHQGIDEETIQDAKKNYREYLRFVYLGLGITGFFLITLISNYFYVNHLNQRTADLESEISSYGPNFSMIDQLRQEKNRKLLLIENSGIQSKHYISFYLDEIAKSVPSSITLSLLEPFPLKEPLKPKKKLEMEMSIISIKGQCNNSKVLDDWMEVLEENDWVTGVELMNYIRQSDALAEFELKLNIKE